MKPKGSKWFGLILPSVTFLFSPTIILLGIYFGCREKMNIRTQLDKMNIQDLE